MPSFDIVIPESFLFIPANFSFISFCFFISFILSKIFRSVIVFFILIISLLSIGYYDLIVKFAVDRYYILTQMNSKIYSYPQKSSENKIESLSMVGVYIHPLKYSTLLSSSEKDEIKILHENYVEKFVDISTYAFKFNQYIYNRERVYLNKYKYDDSLIENKNEEPRFLITKTFKESYFPKVFGKYEYKFIDKKTNIVLATAFKISFFTSNDKFRNKYLYWTQEKEEDFNFSPIQNFEIIYKNLFIDNIR